MTITKDRLKQLEAQRPTHNPERHYTIGGDVEAAVHSNLESERIGELTHGYRSMNSAVESFRTNMALNSREGLARAQFQHVNGQANAHPSQPANNNQPRLDAVDLRTEHGLKRHTSVRDERVKAFAQTMSEGQTQIHTQDRHLRD